LWINYYSFYFLLFSFIVMLLISECWWRDAERESTFNGNHSQLVKFGLKIGILLFISSEVIFFVSFFWSFIHRRTVSDVELGINWPPFQILSFDPVSIPLVNTIILLSSGASITWCHHLRLEGRYKGCVNSLALTIVLGLLFSSMQAFEYVSAPFSLSDRVLGSVFFVSTGFHGLHVLVGTVFLFVSFIKLRMLFNTRYQNVGFECSAWYWHFVDVVWLFLYTLVYWWGC